MLRERQAQLTVSIVFVLIGTLLALPCKWQVGTGRLKPNVAGTQIITHRFPPDTVEQCFTYCEIADRYICTGVNYKLNECHLLVESPETMEIESDPDWEYSIRPLCIDMWLPWKTLKGSYIEEQTLHFSEADGLARCMLECLIGEEFICDAINTGLDERNCSLLRLNTDDSLITVPRENWQYFVRPSWYLESSKSATTAEVYNKGTIERGYHIFTETKIPKSGYLVGWQYYYIKMGECKTKLCVVRKAGKDFYTQVFQSEMAIYDTMGASGRRFQIVSRDVVRVKEGDFLAFQGGCQTLQVSADTSGGQLTISSSDPRPFYNQGERRFVDGVDGIVYRNASPSLKAYVSTYMSLESAPLLYRNHSLVGGQIRLRLPPPLTTDQSIVIAGYRVVCATDSSMIQRVKCSDEVIPVTSESVLLSLDDDTKFYYAAIQIIRNFKGSEIHEGILSPNVVFCTSRNKTEDVTVRQDLVDGLTQKWIVHVTLHYIFEANDQCASEIEFLVNGISTESKAISANMQTTFSLESKAGERYEFSMNLILADRTVVKFWNKEHYIRANK